LDNTDDERTSFACPLAFGAVFGIVRYMASDQYTIYATSLQAWQAMYMAVLGATRSVYLELYIFVDDEMGKKFFDLLERKARQGVEVKLIIDSFGSFAVSKKRIQSLKSAGVDVRLFSERKHRYRGIWKKLISRTHRKILIVDEEIGFIGGVNIQKCMEDWLDIQIRLEGVVVHSLLRAFAKMYIICGGDKKQVKRLLKYRFRVANNEVDFIYDDAHSRGSRVRKKYTEALLKARERVILFSPYYFPDKKLLKALWIARKRGVKIDLLIPFRTDLRIFTYLAYAWFSLMKKMGVNIRLSKKMMHGKGIIVDDEWAMIGSSNLEHTSFHDNYEANVKISNKHFVKKMKHTIEKWMLDSMSLEDLKWEKRGKFHRFKEWVAMKLYNLWHWRY
jgi:cardiolipin synthase A/B